MGATHRTSLFTVLRVRAPDCPYAEPALAPKLTFTLAFSPSESVGALPIFSDVVHRLRCRSTRAGHHHDSCQSYADRNSPERCIKSWPRTCARSPSLCSCANPPWAPSARELWTRSRDTSSVTRGRHAHSSGLVSLMLGSCITRSPAITWPPRVKLEKTPLPSRSPRASAMKESPTFEPVPVRVYLS